jgi:Ca2+:H+ antiporter
MNTPLNNTTCTNYHSIQSLDQPGSNTSCHINSCHINTCDVVEFNKIPNYCVHYVLFVNIFFLTGLSWYVDNSLAHFICSSLAAIPLCGYLGFFLDNVVGKTTRTSQPGIAALLLYSCGNLPEIILSVTALSHDKYQIARESNVGSILSNLILVTGAVYWYLDSQFQRSSNQYPVAINTSLVRNPMSEPTGATSYQAESDQHSPPVANINTKAIIGLLVVPLGCYWLIDSLSDSGSSANLVSHLVSIVFIVYYLIIGFHGTLTNLITSPDPVLAGDGESDLISGQQTLNVPVSVLGLSISTIWLGYVSNVLISSIEPTLLQLKVAPSFLNIVFLPIISNSVEAYQSIRSVLRGDIVTALSVGVGSVVQILWFVYPVLHIVGWTIGHPLILKIDHYQLIMLTTSIIGYLVLLPKPGEYRNLKLSGLSLLAGYLFWGVVVSLV